MDIDDEMNDELDLEELRRTLQARYDEVKANERRLSNLRQRVTVTERAIKDGIEAARVLRVEIANVTARQRIQELEEELAQLRQRHGTEG